MFLLAINKELSQRKAALLGIAELPALISALMLVLFHFEHLKVKNIARLQKVEVRGREKRGLYMSGRRRTRQSFCSSLRCQIHIVAISHSQFGICCFQRGQRSTPKCVCVCVKADSQNKNAEREKLQPHEEADTDTVAALFYLKCTTGTLSRSDSK